MRCLLFKILLAVAVALFPAADCRAHDMALRVADNGVVPMGRLSGEIGRPDLVFIGEIHSEKEHHEAQLAVIKALKGSGARVVVGLEMYRAERQRELDRWVRGELPVGDFKKLYAEFWKLPWGLYEDIFLYAREQGIPLIGLNVPDDLARKVSEKGFSALSPADLKRLPVGISCDVDEGYKDYIRRAHSMHGENGKSFTHFCEAQLLWDKVMAHYLVDYLRKHPGDTVVVLAGVVHSWKKGIPEQVRRQSGFTYKVLLPMSSDRAEVMSADYADYVVN